MLNEFCDWLGSLVGTTVRGRTVLDVGSFVELDRSAHVVLTVAVGRDVMEMIFKDDEELVWHLSDVTQFKSIVPVWEYWDEWEERTQAEFEKKDQS